MPARQGADATTGRLEASQVRAMFDRVAVVYDLLNTVMTAGLHHRWRVRAVELARVGPGSRVLDVATGTGDLAIELVRCVSPGGEVVGSDFSENMLERARIKGAKALRELSSDTFTGGRDRSAYDRSAYGSTCGSLHDDVAHDDVAHDGVARNGAAHNGAAHDGVAHDGAAHNGATRSGPASLSFDWGDALDLPYPDDSFDAATVGFGARNYSDLRRGLQEMARVVRPGGRVVVLEMTTPTRPPLSLFYRLWFDRVVPMIGKLVGSLAGLGRRAEDSPSEASIAQAYTYLPNSVKRFHSPTSLAAEMQRAGCTEIGYVLMAGGIIAVHGATVPRMAGEHS